MHPISLIAQTLDDIELPCDPVQDICAVTGLQGQSIPRKELLGKSFTNIDLLKNPESDFVSIEAYKVMKYKWQRMSSWFCDGKEFKRLDRVGVREMIFASMPEMWCAYATTTYKKHGALNAVINTGNRRIWLFEMQLVDCSDLERVNKWWNQLNRALRLGFGRTVLETCKCPPYLIRKIGMSEWMEFERWSRNKYQSSLYRFLCYLLPSQEELKNEKNVNAD